MDNQPLNAPKPYTEADYVHPEVMLQEKYGQKSIIKKILDVILSWYFELLWFLILAYRVVFSKPAFPYHRQGDPLAWKINSRGLYVFIHGLRLHPAVWMDHLDKLADEKDPVDVLVPYVFKGGECSLEVASESILAGILDYIKAHPGRPVCIIGLSNGGRIGLWLECHLRKLAPDVCVKISSISGVFFGTRTVDRLKRSFLTRWMVGCDAVCEEMSFGSATARALLDLAKAPFAPGKRDYEFYACTEDIELSNLCTALPMLNKGERYYVVQGKGHHSILPVIYKQQMDGCRQWIRAHQHQ